MLPSDPMKSTVKERLKELLIEHSLKVGDFILSNRKRSDHYFDCKMVTLNHEGAILTGEAVLEEILRLPEPVSAIGGLTHGADPIITAVMMQASSRGLQMDGFYVRKEAKKHGTHKLVENAPAPGTKVVIVDDVVTEGGSVLQAFDEATKIGCKVVAVIAIVDRQEGGTDKVRAKAPIFVSLYTVKDFLADIERLKCQQNMKKSEKHLTEVCS